MYIHTHMHTYMSTPYAFQEDVRIDAFLRIRQLVLTLSDKVCVLFVVPSLFSPLSLSPAHSLSLFLSYRFPFSLNFWNTLSKVCSFLSFVLRFLPHTRRVHNKEKDSERRERRKRRKKRRRERRERKREKRTSAGIYLTFVRHSNFASREVTHIHTHTHT